MNIKLDSFIVRVSFERSPYLNMVINFSFELDYRIGVLLFFLNFDGLILVSWVAKTQDEDLTYR